jgi:hypothetical protein
MAAICSLTLFFVFKLFYPYPNMVMDSYVYIKAMAQNLGANSYPIGYSKFLQLFSLFSRSTTLLVWFQFLFLEFACLLLFFTLLYFFRPGKWACIVLFVFLFFNPLLFYVSNFIMADALFTTLSLLWLVQLIWIVGRPRPYMIIVHALILVLAFTIRYNALYYPIAASFVLLLSSLRPWLKVAGIAFQFALVGLFILYTSRQMEQLTGMRQFSPFGGWKMANNALYMYEHVSLERNDPVPAKFSRLDEMVRKNFHGIHVTDDLLDYFSRPTGSLYMVDYQSSPLIHYMDEKYGTDTVFLNFKKWGPMGAYCGEYGSYLVRKYPIQYIRYFAWPNLIRYFTPPTEIFWYPSPYYLRDDAIGQIASKWFRLRTLTVDQSYIDFRTSILAPYPIIIAIVHMIFVASLIGFFLFRGYRKVTKPVFHIVLAVVCAWICDLCFSVTASAVVLRYQIFVMIFEFAFAVQFIDFICRKSEDSSTQLAGLQ